MLVEDLEVAKKQVNNKVVIIIKVIIEKCKTQVPYRLRNSSE